MASPAPSSERANALVGLLVANLFWGLSFPLVKALVSLHEKLAPGTGTWLLTAMVLVPRFLLATVIMIAWQLFRGGGLGVTRAEAFQGVVIGLFASGGMILQSDGLQFTAASTSAFLTQFYAILIPIYVSLRTRHNPGGRVWVSAAMVLVGVAVLGRFDWHELRLGRGEWETLLSSLFFMGQILWLEKKEFAGNRAGKITLVMFATQTVVYGAMALAVAREASHVAGPMGSGVWWALTMILTVVCTVGAYFLMNTWQPKITATEAGLMYCVEPIFGSMMALYLPAIFSTLAGINYPNETATWTLLVGGGLITAANVLIQLKRGPVASPRPES